MNLIDKIHANIVFDLRRYERQAAAKGGVANSRKARLQKIEAEIDREWAARKKASETHPPR